MGAGQLAALMQASADVVEHELHVKLEQLFAAEGGLERQKIGGYWQVPVRSLRSPASSALGFLTGVRAGDGGGLARGCGCSGCRRVRRSGCRVWRT